MIRVASRRLVLAAICAAAGACALPALAQGYPSKPVKVISPFAPGGGLDVVLRPLLQKISESTGQNFYIDNKSGANGLIGIDMGAKSAPDGYTLIGVTSGAVTINPAVYAKMPYDTLRDLVPVSNIGSAPFVMVVNPSVAARNVPEFVALVKAKPGELPFGSPGVGGTNHLGAESFLQATGTRMVHVPYRGSQPLMTDLIGGQVLMAFDSIMATAPQVRAGRLKAIGVASPKRSPVAPEIPTLAEAGFPDFTLSSWYGLMAPAGTPREVIAKLTGEINKALANPELRAHYAGIGIDVVGNSPEQFAAEIREDMSRWAKVAKTANVHAD